MFCGLNAKKNHCLIFTIENLVAKIRSVKFSFLLSINAYKVKLPTSSRAENIGAKGEIAVL